MSSDSQIQYISLVNGLLTDSISVADRAVNYGHSVYETIALSAGQPLLLTEHLARLQSGCQRLSIPLDLVAVNEQIQQAVALLDQPFANAAVLKVIVTMGAGGRGYANPCPATANNIILLSEFPKHYFALRRQGVQIGLVDVRLAQQPLLAGIKHGNRLEQILAREQWQPGWHEALLRDTDDYIIEGTHSNLFIVTDTTVVTPDLSACGVKGIMRERVIKELANLGYPVSVGKLREEDVLDANEIFLCNSLIGIMPVIQYQQQTYNIGSLALKVLTRLENNGAISLNQI